MFEHKILSNLIYNEHFTRKVAPFIDPAYFHDKNDKVLIQEILSFFTKFNKLPTVDIIKIEVANRRDLTDKELLNMETVLDSLQPDQSNLDWLIEKTEKFCKDKAVYNAILQGIRIIDGNDDKLTQEAIPKILSDALAVSFDTQTGHDYIDNASDRFEFYHRIEEKVAFDLDMMNKITAGGLSKKSLNVVLAGCVHPETKIKVRLRKRI